MRTKFFCLFSLLLLLPNTLWASNCKKYENALLIGTVVEKTFPGRPNYESVAEGDEPEKVWLLHLLQPICVDGNAQDERESNVSDVQLVLNKKQYEQYHGLMGKIVSAAGTLFHSITGHHHTKILITVVSLNEPIVN